MLYECFSPEQGFLICSVKLMEQIVVLAFMAIHISPQKDQKTKVNEESEGKTSSKHLLTEI